jgi:hypothetical protein
MSRLSQRVTVCVPVWPGATDFDNDQPFQIFANAQAVDCGILAGSCLSSGLQPMPPHGWGCLNPTTGPVRPTWHLVTVEESSVWSRSHETRQAVALVREIEPDVVCLGAAFPLGQLAREHH